MSVTTENILNIMNLLWIQKDIHKFSELVSEHFWFHIFLWLMTHKFVLQNFNILLVTRLRVPECNLTDLLCDSGVIFCLASFHIDSESISEKCVLSYHFQRLIV